MKWCRTGFESFIEPFRVFPGLKSFSVFACTIGFIAVFVWAVCYGFGFTPASTSINLIWWKWQLPIAVSRFLDLLLVPIVILLIRKITLLQDDQDWDSFATWGEFDHDPLLDLSALALIASFGAGMIFGIVYAPIVFALVCTGIPIISILVFVGGDLMGWLWKSIWSLFRREKVQ